MSAKDVERLRWRCRRGMLELDLVLAAFLERHAAGLSAQELEQLQQLLDYSDNDLWELVMGRREPEAETCKPLLALLRAS